MIYLIQNENDRLLYWNNADGWGSLRTAQGFTSEVAKDVDLPIEGTWVQHGKEA